MSAARKTEILPELTLLTTILTNLLACYCTCKWFLLTLLTQDHDMFRFTPRKTAVKQWRHTADKTTLTAYGESELC